jgi:hypothetical protein
MQPPPPSFPYGIFVETPENVDELEAMAQKFDTKNLR